MSVLFIIGAGASASIDPEKVPVMETFFQLAAERIEVHKPEYWLPFAITDHTRLFSPNIELEQLADEILILNEIRQRLEWEKKEIPKEITENLRENVTRYRTCFLADKNRTSANLEEVFQKFLEHSSKSGFNESYSRFQYLVNILFQDLNIELKTKFLSSTYVDLAKALKELKNPENIRFISFNYEAWLEKALFKEGLWEPILGYNEYAAFAYVLNVAELKSNTLIGADYVSLGKSEPVNKKPIIILKPNGSLTWREADWSKLEASPDRELFVTLDNSGCAELYRDQHIFRVTHPAHDENSQLGTFAQPVIHPPTFSKYRAQKMDWDVDRQIIEQLSIASTIVVIGWSMPSGDNHFGKLLEYSLMKRMGGAQGQPPRLVICDKADSDTNPAFIFHCYRLNSAFRCYETIRWSKGFTKEFVDFLSKQITNNGKVG
ncbi:MAG: hypothetical protein LHV69_10715 [Elusimicrobia bacterium]|nr:hypothetical protein [Candidatus Obscuribacterium magneticum]